MPAQCRSNKRFEVTQSQNKKVPLRTFNNLPKKEFTYAPVSNKTWNKFQKMSQAEVCKSS